MQSEALVTVISPRRCLLLALFLTLVPLAGQAADAAQAAPVDAAPADSRKMDAILEELRAIRQVLEKIEKQGLAGGARRPA
ncbi:MAG: hypothetical protein PVI50_07230, partial [Gammaproteobacteria bacterium]